MKIGVVIIARNESKHLDATLTRVVNQTVQPTQIVLVDDNSKDNTANIAKEYGCKVVKFPYEHPNWVISKNLSLVFNLGLRQLQDDLDYVCILGADHILNHDYFERVLKKMNDKTKIASGVIRNEEKIINPRGSGRIIDYKWFKEIGFFPINYGYESYILFKCRTMGYDFEVYRDIVTVTQRPTTTNYGIKKFVHKGRAFRALGYYPHVCLIASLRYKKKPLCTILMMIGYLLPNTEKYEVDVRENMRSYQAKRVKKALRTFRLYE